MTMKFLMLIFILCLIYILKRDHNIIDYQRNVGQPLFPTRGLSLPSLLTHVYATCWKRARLFENNFLMEIRVSNVVVLLMQFINHKIHCFESSVKILRPPCFVLRPDFLNPKSGILRVVKEHKSSKS